MNLGQLEVLVAIVDTGSLTEAAEVVSLTQSAVSYSLSKLEAELGVTLLERGRSGVTVTRIGAEVVQHARTILAQVEVIRQKTARERGLAVGKLRFGCTPTMPPRLLTGILRDFQHQYPDIEIVLFEGTSLELREWLDTGIIDIATVLMPEQYPIAIPLMQSEMKFMVADNHPLATSNNMSLSALSDESLIGPKAEYEGFVELLREMPITLPHLRYEVSTMSTIMAMVRENMGVAIVPEVLADAILDGLILLDLEPQLRFNVFLATQIDSPAAHAFLDKAHKWAKEHGFLAHNI